MIHFAAVCVGSAFSTNYLTFLYRGLERHAPGDWDLTVIHDGSDGGRVEKWARGMSFFPDFPSKDIPRVRTVLSSMKTPPSWWHKLELFRPDIWPDGSRVIYFDLDTVIVGDISPLYDLADFALLRWGGAWFPYGSGVMSFRTGRYGFLRSEWNQALEPSYPKGDQQWIVTSLGRHDHLVNPITSDLVCSYKKDWTKGRRNAPVVAFHGKPRPADLSDEHELKKKWKS